MTTPPVTLAERLMSLKKRCEVPRQSYTVSTALGDHRFCTACQGTLKCYVLPDYIRRRCDLPHRRRLHGINEDRWENVSCASAGCPGISPSTESMDWWRAWGKLAPRRSIAITVLPDGSLEGSVALGGTYTGAAVVVLVQAIAALPEVKEAMEKADAPP